jgi:hypothetical protein
VFSDEEARASRRPRLTTRVKKRRHRQVEEVLFRKWGAFGYLLPEDRQGTPRPPHPLQRLVKEDKRRREIQWCSNGPVRDVTEEVRKKLLGL